MARTLVEFEDGWKKKPAGGGGFAVVVVVMSEYRIDLLVETRA